MEELKELRQHIARVLEQRTTSIINDAVALMPFAGLDDVDADVWIRLGEHSMQVLIAAVGGARIEPRGALVSELRRVLGETRMSVPNLHGLIYLLERAALDELALDESFGATSEPWPAVAQVVRRASFDVLAGVAERLAQLGGEYPLIDPLTGLRTRAMLMAVLEKEIHRAERFAHPFALILFDIDQLSAINDKHGYAFGDRVLERVGIVIRNFFREQDWVSRWSGDEFGVLLPETQRAHAEQLAERVRVTVHDRLALRDYRTDEQVPVTVSVALVLVDSVDATITAEQLMKEAEHAVHRAKHAGRNRVERVEIRVGTASPPNRDLPALSE